MSKARDLANAGTALGAVTATELAFVDGVTSAIQTQLDAKAPSSTAVTLTDTQTLTNKTLTNPVIASVINNSLVDAKGDVLTATADNTPARLAVGANDTVLTADSTAATGLKWAAVAAIPANASATVATAQSTTSTTYTDLATAGPSVTLTTGTKALVIITANIGVADPSVSGYMSYAVSGATTIAASDTVAIRQQSTQSSRENIRASAVSVPTLTAGSNTFTAKYRLSQDTDDSFSDRSIFVMNLA